MEEEGWYKHFQASITERRKRLEAIEELFSVYEVLRKRDEKYSLTTASSTPVVDASSDDQVRRLDAALQQKSKQIESQQALLSDLQAQLSAKEHEVRDVTARLQTSVHQSSQLQAQLTSTHALLQEKELEIIRLRNEIRAMESADKIEVIEQLNRAAPVVATQDLQSLIPRRVVLSQSLAKAQVPPNFVVATHGTGGPQIVAVGTRKLHCFSAGSGGMLFEAEVASSASSASLMTACIAPENDLVLVGTSESQLSLLDMNGRLLKDLKGHSGKVKGCGFLGSKTKAFSVATDRTLKLWDLTRASPIRSVPVTSQLVGGVATLDGTMMVTCHLNGKLTVWSQTDKICEVDAHTDACLGLALSPDGRFITSVGKDDTVAIVDIHMAQSGPIHTLSGFKALLVDTAPTVSMDSRLISVCTSGGIQSWDLLVGTNLGCVHTDATALTWVSGNPTEAGPTQQIVTVHPNSVIKWWSP